MKNEYHKWIPACGNSEVPFMARNCETLHYMYCPATGEHAYYNVTRDVFLTNEEAWECMGTFR